MRGATQTMTDVAAGPKDVFLDQFARFSEFRAAELPEWLQPIRAAAIDRFAATRLPTMRDENWRFTNVAPIAKTAFQLANGSGRPIKPAALKPLAVPGLSGPQLVFINGRFEPALSSLGDLDRRLQIVPLIDALETQARVIQPLLASHPGESQDAFTNLNTAFIEDGAFIHIARGAKLDQPIQLLCIAAANGAPLMTHPRNIIVADESSELTVIEHYVTLDDSVYLTNAVTDIIVGANANVHHYLLEQEGAQAFNISTLRVRQGRDSQFESHSALLGGKLVRNNVHAILDGTGCQCLINGLYVGSDQQHMDNHMRVEHAKPHGDSRQFYKGILDDRATAVFSGRIVVHRDAQKTDAKQTNKNLLLSDDAHVDTQPQLEIYADDVKCTHGATIGQMDEQAIFYLRARGIALDAARSLLIHAFAGESLSRMQIEPVRSYLDRILLKRLPGGDLLEHMQE